MTWLAIQSHPGAEEQARDSLTDDGFEAFLPLCWAKRRMRGREQSFYVPLYPGYLFARQDDRWPRMARIDGVLRVLMAGEAPGLVADEIVTELDRAMKMGGGAIMLEWQKKPVEWKLGDQLRIESGPWSGLWVTFEKYQRKGRERRVKCSLDFSHGRRTISIHESMLAPLYAVSAASEPRGAVRAAAIGKYPVARTRIR